jgi:23S rRNA (adenine2503-C2)-methyltransferase
LSSIIKVDTIQRSDDGTIKNAVRLHDGLVVESVLIPPIQEQLPAFPAKCCSLDCSFCATARLKE